MLPTPGHERRAAEPRSCTPLSARYRTHNVRLLYSDACAAALLSSWKKTSLFQRASLVGLLGGLHATQPKTEKETWLHTCLYLRWST